MVAIALERLRRHVEQAVALLPGVVGVGVGQRDCPVTGATVFRLYVTRKFLRSALARDNIAPQQHDGAAIDVVAHGGVGIACSSTPNVFPGDQISLETSNQIEAYGTIGLIVTKIDGGQAKRFMLTNYHVVEKTVLGVDHIDVYKPAKGTCNNPVGATRYDSGFGDKRSDFNSPSFPNFPFKVDAALVNIKAKVKSGNINNDIKDKISQFGPNVRNLLTEFKADFDQHPVTTDDLATMIAQAKALNQVIAAKNIEVRKFGATTGFTRGVITGACIPDGEKRAIMYELIISPLPSEPETTETYKTKKSEADRTLSVFDPSTNFATLPVTCTISQQSGDDWIIKTKGRIFASLGDSGSAVLDTGGNIVGLLQQSSGTKLTLSNGDPAFAAGGLGQAQFIVPAFELVGLPLNAIVPPAEPQFGPGLFDLEMEEPPETVEQRVFEAAEASFGHTPDGRRLLRLARQHLREIRSLIHHRRQVMVTWHRIKGPAYIAAITKAVRDPSYSVPDQIDGESLVAALRKLRSLLHLEGSTNLKESLVHDGDWLISLFDHPSGVAGAVRRIAGHDRDGDAADRACLHIVNARGVPGTVSALLRAPDGTLNLLTNHHVLFGGGAAKGDQIWMVHSHGGQSELIEIGATIGGYIGRVMHDGVPVFVDYALGTLDPERLPVPLRNRLLIITEVADASIGGWVRKDGVSTGQTTGRVVDVAYPDLPFIHGRQYEASGQLLIKAVSAAGLPTGTDVNFCTPGDSGAVIFDEHQRAVGLLWGANANGEGIACPLRPIVEALADGSEPARETGQIEGAAI